MKTRKEFELIDEELLKVNGGKSIKTIIDELHNYLYIPRIQEVIELFEQGKNHEAMHLIGQLIEEGYSELKEVVI